VNDVTFQQQEHVIPRQDGWIISMRLFLENILGLHAPQVKTLFIGR